MKQNIYGWVYAVCCPISGDIKYIGKTENYSSRIEQHLRMCINRKMYHWTESLLKLGLKPTFKKLAICKDRYEYAKFEGIMIRHFYKYYDLLNIQLYGADHQHIDIIKLKLILKSKKITYQKLSDKLNISFNGIRFYMSGKTQSISLEKANKINDYILSL
jgi:hypothetical protein